MVPFLASNFFHRANSNHDIIVLNTMGGRPKDNKRDTWLLFCYEAYWAKGCDAKGVIKEA